MAKRIAAYKISESKTRVIWIDDGDQDTPQEALDKLSKGAFAIVAKSEGDNATELQPWIKRKSA